MKRIAIIGASQFQNKLILRAKEMGLETHVFAWKCGDVGERSADFFHPISIIEKDLIVEECRNIGVDAVATIGSDVGNITVAYVAEQLGLNWNSVDCVAKSTNKHLMRKAFEQHGNPSPKSLKADGPECADTIEITFPAIVKPSDRSGSRGITKVENRSELGEAIEKAIAESFEGAALVEEFVGGREFSVEYLSWNGNHRFLSITEKFTTGSPHFIEMGHLEPARVTDAEAEDIKCVVEKALDSLGVKMGASHSEVKIDEDGKIWIIEIGSRMGGDCIGSDLVELSTGYDFVAAVINCAMGLEPEPIRCGRRANAMVRFIFSASDMGALERAREHDSESLVFVSPIELGQHDITDSATRYGFFIMANEALSVLEPYLPNRAQG